MSEEYSLDVLVRTPACCTEVQQTETFLARYTAMCENASAL